ncbi:AAA family ATPase [Alienimonas californiensis]|uniref:ATPase RavA n=1 Tax=Alienimonas californiensis TaxID=2527989 RepID=A0A517P9V9_9PLAN|nr:MoxR family ATPase [Alienimonas californiensis]QDT16166.1 ATPase RavA [Alienimonas californiensis]
MTDATAALPHRSNGRAPDFTAPARRPQIERLRANLAGVILGKPEAIDLLLTALLAGGSVLMEDVPGVGKTTLAKALAKSLSLDFHRVQFTPDLLPADILGGNVFNPADGSLTFRPGPIFCNVLLADEINRASPRTQSALLEAMAEGQATVEGKGRPLPAPFFVLATQNPADFHGTFPLPEAQLDRFLVRLTLDYPAADAEIDMLFDQARVHPLETVEPVLNGEDLLRMQAAVRAVAVERPVAAYVVEVCRRTRQEKRLDLGASPRGSLMLFRAAQAAAYLAGRDFVRPDDVQRVATAVLAHRCMLSGEAKFSGTKKADVLREAIAAVPVPA